jgi:hypothetical protein
MAMFDKKEKGDETKVMSDDQKEEMLENKMKDLHPVAREFESATKDTLHREWKIFESRYRAVLNLKEDAPKTEVKKAVARVKRASLDVRDALKELGQFKV